MEASTYKSEFVTVNGVQLHYLDWGGSGPVLLFIPGLGCTAYIFDQLARRFTDHFHVLALTRRGHGDSDCPETGYDPDTLTEDLKQFLDAIRADQVILAGHSFGYIELTRFAILHPERLHKLVFLDASYDNASKENEPAFQEDPLAKLYPPWPEKGPETIEEYITLDRKLNPALDAIWGPLMEEEVRHRLTRNSAGKIEGKMSGAAIQALCKTMAAYHPDFEHIQVPVLSFFAIQDGSDYLSSDFMTAEQQAQVMDFFKRLVLPFQKKYIEQFRHKVPDAKIVEIPHGHHYCFIKQEELVFTEMRQFLSNCKTVAICRQTSGCSPSGSDNQGWETPHN